MFENEVGLKADSIRINEIFTPAEWVISDDILLLRSKEDHPIFYTYSLPELKFIESFGFKGRGPDEYIAPYIVRNGDGRIYLYDNGNRKLKTLRPSKDGHVVTDVGTLSGAELFNTSAGWRNLPYTKYVFCRSLVATLWLLRDDSEFHSLLNHHALSVHGGLVLYIRPLAWSGRGD